MNGFTGRAANPDPTELNKIETELLEAVNSARLRYERGECSSAEYAQALRKFNEFAAAKPLTGDRRLRGLEDEYQYNQAPRRR